jgi:hypothetical protein
MNWTADTLYKTAYNLHYEQYDIDAADKLYRQLLRDFPKSQQAAWAATQVENIASYSLFERGRFRNKKEQTESSQSEPSPTQGEVPSTVPCSFQCVSCGVRLRIILPIFSDTFRCPSCTTQYRVMVSQEWDYAVIVIPMMRPKAKHAAQQSTMSSTVKSAFDILHADLSSSFDDIKICYRTMIHQYHPDKVAHLGPDLRHLAEEKTKSIVNAYDILKDWFESL